jgi:hypothetical protein
MQHRVHDVFGACLQAHQPLALRDERSEKSSHSKASWSSYRAKVRTMESAMASISGGRKSIEGRDVCVS